MHRITLNLNKITQKTTRKLIPCLSVFILLLCLSVAWAQNARAQSPTPTGVREEIKEKVQERIEQIQTEFKKRAFWGTLKEITNSTLVLDTPRGERRVKTDEETKFFGAGKKEIKLADLEIGNFIIALGYWQENGTLEGKRITALTQAPKPAVRRYAVYGRVADISEEEKILSIVHPTKSDVTYQVKVESSTIITKKVEGKIKKVTFSEIEIGDRVVAVGTKAEGNETITAKLIHVIPGKATGLEEVTPTPTEKVTPTPTKKPTPTPAE